VIEHSFRIEEAEELMNIIHEAENLTGDESELIIDDCKFVAEFKKVDTEITLRNLYKRTINNPGGHLNFGCMSDFR